MKHLLLLGLFILASLIHVNAAPKKRAVPSELPIPPTEGKETQNIAKPEVIIDPNNVVDVGTGNMQDTFMGMVGTPDVGADPVLINDVAQTPGAGQADLVNLGTDNALDANTIVDPPVEGQNSGDVLSVDAPKDGNIDVTAAQDAVAGNAPEKGNDAVFICIETRTPDSFKAGMIKQTELASSKPSFGKLGEFGKKMDKLFHQFFQTFVYSETGSGAKSIDKLEPFADMGLKNKDKIDTVNEARNPFSFIKKAFNTISKHASKGAVTGKSGLTNKMQDGKNIVDMNDIGTDPAFQGKDAMVNSQNSLTNILTGSKARTRSKQMFGQMEHFGEQINNILGEFFPGLINIKVSTGPKSELPMTQKQTRKDVMPVKDKDSQSSTSTQGTGALTNDVLPADGYKPALESAKSKGIGLVDTFESGFDSIFKRMKPYTPDNYLSDTNSPNDPGIKLPIPKVDNFLSVGRRMSKVFKNMMKSFLKDTRKASPKPIADNTGVTKNDITPVVTKESSSNPISGIIQSFSNIMQDMAPKIAKAVSDSMKSGTNTPKQEQIKPVEPDTALSGKQSKGPNLFPSPTNIMDVLAPNIAKLVSDSIKSSAGKLKQEQSKASGPDIAPNEKSIKGIDSFSHSVDNSKGGIGMIEPPAHVTDPHMNAMDDVKRSFEYWINEFKRTMADPFIDTTAQTFRDNMQMFGQDAMSTATRLGDRTTLPYRR